MQRSPALSLRIASLIPYAMISIAVLAATFYAFPQTDDFCTFGRLFSHSGGNPLLETWYLYQSWTGRYSSSLVVALAGWLTSVTPFSLHAVYSACLAALVVMFSLSCLAASRLVSQSRRASLSLAALIFTASMVLIPSKLEEYLWLTGAAVYFAGISVLLFTLKCLADRQFTNTQPSHRYDWPLLCLIVLCVGFNEFLALALGGYLAIVTVIGIASRENVKQNGKYLLVFGAAFLVTVLAPGNFARDSGISANRHDVMEATRLAWSSLSLFKKALIETNGILLGLLLVAAACAGWLLSHEPAERARRFLPVPLVLILGFPMHLWTFSFLTGEATPGRIINQAFILTIAGSMLLAAWGAQRLASSRRMNMPAIPTVLILVTGIALLSGTQFKQFAKSTREFAPIWRYQQLDRHARLLSSARNGTPASLAPFAPGDSAPPIYKGADITNDAGNWINRCVADYYSVPSVQLAPAN